MSDDRRNANYSKEQEKKIEDDGDIKKWVDETFPNGHKRSVHVHFLDFGEPTEKEKHSKAMVANLSKHLKTLSQYSDGVIMTCGGQKGKHDIVHKIMPKLMGDSNVKEFQPKEGRSRVVVLGQPGKPPCTKGVHHVLKMDDTNWPSSASEDRKSRQIREIRKTFISLMTSLPRNSLLQEQEEATAVVCVLMDSGEESLSAALMARDRDIPLIVMKGGDGGLDHLVELHEQMELRWERRRIGNEIRYVAVPVPDSKLTTPPGGINKELLDKLKQHLPLITIYRPQNDKDTSLDVVILEALIINKKEKEMSAFLKALMDNRKSNTDTSNFIHNRDMQWDYFIRSLKDGGAAAAKAFLGCLQLNCDDFHFGKLLQLYDCKTNTFLRTHRPIEILKHEKSKEKPKTLTEAQVLIEANTKASEAIIAMKRLYMARRDLYKYLQKPALFPLPCEGINCQHCTFTLADLQDKNDLKTEASEQRWQTCLHPVQELFLWSLLCSNSDVTTALWEYTKDRLGAALFARAVYSGIAKREKKHKRMDNYYQLKENSRWFKQLAILTLTSSTEVGEQKTHVLLRKPCLWWCPVSFDSEAAQKTCPLNWWSNGPQKHFTVLDVALQTRCKAFIAQSIPQQLVSEWWLENPKNDALPTVQAEGKELDVSRTSCFQDNEVQPTADGNKNKWFKLQYLKSTRARFLICIVWLVAFILLFSYVLLKGVTGTAHWTNLALIVWVVDILVEEIRQWQSAKVRLKTRDRKMCGPVKRMLSRYCAKGKEYFRQGWNDLDALSIVIFAVGSGLTFFEVNSRAHVAGRLLLAADIVLFILRFLQVFVVVKHLGVWIIMAKKMAKDTAYFMMILLSIVYGYAVASESLLKAEGTELDWYLVPHKAFFSVFGEFDFDDIKDNKSSPMTCRWIPVYLGIFVVMTNVLLLNLLIARLSSLYTKMEGKAMEYQAWQTCQAILEFQHRSWLPPPFNILCAVWSLWLAATCSCCCSCCRGQHPSSSADAGGFCGSCNARQNTFGAAGQNRYCGCLALSKNVDHAEDPMKCKYQMYNTCLRLNQDIGENTDINVTTKTALNIKLNERKYTLFGKRPLLLWKADPTEVREFNCDFKPEYSIDQETCKQYSDLDKFEKVQAEWAITQLRKGIHGNEKTAQ